MMQSLLNIKIKAFKLWKVAALVLLAIVITCCGTDVSDLTQPGTGTVGKPIQVSFQVSYCGNGDDNDQVNLIVAVLLPIGWQGQKNMTMTWSCLTAGSGKGALEPVPSSVVEQQSGLPWPQALLNQFGIKNNYVNNMQWVVFQSVNQYEVSSITAPVTVNITLTPGADDKNAEVNMEYLVAESKNGLQAPDTYVGAGCSNVPYEYYQLYDGPRFTLTGGNPTTNVDYADPQYGAVVPGAALIDDYITVSFNGAATPTPTALANAPAVYLHARAYATDGTTYTVNEQTSKTIMTETSSSSNTYKLTLWPRAFFGFPSTKTLDHMEYIFTDATGNTQVGFNNTSTPFSYDFLCQ
jgi:hypothetical protein